MECCSEVEYKGYCSGLECRVCCCRMVHSECSLVEGGLVYWEPLSGNTAAVEPRRGINWVNGNDDTKSPINTNCDSTILSENYNYPIN